MKIISLWLRGLWKFVIPGLKKVFLRSPFEISEFKSLEFTVKWEKLLEAKIVMEPDTFSQSCCAVYECTL